MKEKFKQWADYFRAFNDFEVRAAGEFFQREADMSDDEPEENPAYLSTPMVTKANRDWHLQQRMQFAVELRQCEFQRDSYKLELAAAKAKIVELEKQISPMRAYFGDGVGTFNPPSDQLKYKITIRDETGVHNYEDWVKKQPKRPLLQGQPEVCDDLLFAIRNAHSMNTLEWMNCMIGIKKLLVGDVP